MPSRQPKAPGADPALRGSFAAIYTPAIFAIAVAVAVGGPWLFAWSWTQALYKALVLLVIACPCALGHRHAGYGVSGFAAAARRGILIKGGVYLEEARKLRAIALDKTGTITEGKPRLVATEVLWPPNLNRGFFPGRPAWPFDHPVSKAIATSLNLPENGLTDFTASRSRHRGPPGRPYLILGNHRLIEDQDCAAPRSRRVLPFMKIRGEPTLLATEDRVLAIFAVADTIKESSREAITDLHRLGVTSVMLTGDNVATATSIARQAGIDDARGNLLPEEKLAPSKNCRGAMDRRQ
jgi:Cd2+/Zn2+-exporting ATPase